VNITEDRHWVVSRRVMGYLASQAIGRTVSAREVADRCSISLQEAIDALGQIADRAPANKSRRGRGDHRRGK
jgi:hypothetical protein